MRGHGPASHKRGDVTYIGQLEDDIVDFIEMLRKKDTIDTLVIGGHSSGGGLAIRFAGGRFGHYADAFILLAPYLQYNAPTIRPESGGWANPNIGRIIGLTMLNNIGITRFNHMRVIDFNLPQEFRDGTETLSYSYRLNTSYAPSNYQKDLGAIVQPTLLLVGTADEAFFAEKFESVVSRYTKANVMLLEGITHMGVAVSPDVHLTLQDWLKNL